MFTERKDLQAETALALAQSAITHARANGWQITVAICDRSGHLLAFLRTDDVGVGTRARLLTWAGGLPIFADGVCVGGIGVSGAKDHEDLACAHAALEAAGLSASA